jgi:hypothetical protein
MGKFYKLYIIFIAALILTNCQKKDATPEQENQEQEQLSADELKPKNCTDNQECSCNKEKCTIECGVGGICSCTGAGCLTICPKDAKCTCTGEKCNVLCMEGATCNCQGKNCQSIPVKTCPDKETCTCEHDQCLLECGIASVCSCSGRRCIVICHESATSCSCSGPDCVVGECASIDDPRCHCTGDQSLIAPPLQRIGN